MLFLGAKFHDVALAPTPDQHSPMAVSFAALPSVDEREREREMSQYQQGLVDTCFEEGQYESGISVLEQLRSPQIKPSE